LRQYTPEFTEIASESDEDDIDQLTEQQMMAIIEASNINTEEREIYDMASSLDDDESQVEEMESVHECEQDELR
jgi:hypothetical protein